MTAFYSEFDPKAAAWLRELIKQGHIADGVVDERDLWDVSPDDLRGFTQVHLCAGIGVWSYALRRAGWPDDRPCWTGSFPCQPFSAAGKGEGFADERHLWPAGQYLIEQCRPRTLFGEQVASKDAEPWLDAVQADLEAMGYAFGACAFPSASIGAPHIRDRTYWVADAEVDRRIERLALRARAGERDSEERASGRTTERSSDSRLANNNNKGLEGRRQPGRERTAERFAGAGGVVGGLALTDGGDASAERQQRGGEQRQQPQDGVAGGLADTGSEDQGGRRVQRSREGDSEGLGPSRERSAGLRTDGGLANAARSGRREERADAGRLDGGDRAQGLATGLGAGGSDSGLADASGDGARGEPRDDAEASRLSEVERQSGHSAALSQRAGADGGGRGVHGSGGLPGDGPRPGPTNGLWRAADWLLCRDGKWRPVEPGTFPLAHGAPARVGRLRGYGNAINSQAAQVWIEAYLEATGERPYAATTEAAL